jgi:hypothetical protein
MSDTPCPRWYQFSLRTLFVLVLVISIPFAWAGYSMNWIRQRRAMIESGCIRDQMPPSLFASPRKAPYGLWLFGEPGYRVLQCDIGDDRIADCLFPEAFILVRMRNARSESTNVATD